IYHSDALHVIERFTRVDTDTIQYEAVIDDPKTWIRRFTIAFPLKRDASYGMFEYACHEGNYGLRNILSAARATDRSRCPAYRSPDSASGNGVISPGLSCGPREAHDRRSRHRAISALSSFAITTTRSGRRPSGPTTPRCGPSCCRIRTRAPCRS